MVKLIVWPVQGCKKKVGKEERQEIKKGYISRMRGATHSGRISTKLGIVFD